MKLPGYSSIGFWTLFVICGLFAFAYANINNDDDEWIDPFDLLNYDHTTKRMRKPPEVRFMAMYFANKSYLLQKSNLVFMFHSQQVTQMCQPREESSAQTPVNCQSVLTSPSA